MGSSRQLSRTNERGIRVFVNGLLATEVILSVIDSIDSYDGHYVPASSRLSPLTLEAPNTLLSPLGSHRR